MKIQVIYIFDNTYTCIEPMIKAKGMINIKPRIKFAPYWEKETPDLGRLLRWLLIQERAQ